MRKSSLGRRSSTHIPVRVPSLGGSSSSSKRRCSADKKSSSSIRPPGFASQGQNYRSQSEDRESYGGRSTMVRSNTAGALPSRGMGAMTPVTPRQSDHYNNMAGASSARSSRSQAMSTDSNRRMSSIGGKNSRKDTRPLSEKPFQQAGQLKVQQYFEYYAPDIVGQGNSIRPMNTKLFVDMMDNLLKNIDNRIVITKSNYLEELPPLLRKLGYRSKVDRSWLMTVNTPHSWQHVIGVLSWLVDIFECMNCVNPFEMMYGNDLGEPTEDDELSNADLKIDKEFIEYVKKTHKMMLGEIGNDDEFFDRLDAEYIEKQIIENRCADEDFEILQRQIDLVREELDAEIKKRDFHQEALQSVQEKYNAAKSDAEESVAYIENSKRYLENIEMKISTLDQDIEMKKTILAKKKEELQKLQDKVGSQEITVDDKDNIVKEKQDLQRMIHAYESSIREFEKSAFAADIKFAEDQRKLEKLIVDYNKLITENISTEPRLANVEIKLTLINNTDNPETEEVDNNLKKLKEDIKSSIQDLLTRKNELEKLVLELKQDENDTREEIAKVTAMLEGVECDEQKQRELINKESQKLNDERHRYEKLTKEITEELSQFDQEKLEKRKIELKNIKHDWELLQKRGRFVMEEHMKIAQQGMDMVAAAAERLNRCAEEFHSHRS